MRIARIPTNEESRLEALRALAVLDTGPEEEFDALVKAASIVCGVPISLISLIDSERQWFKANIGLPGVTETPRDIAFCSHAILDEAVFEVPDATQDARFADNPLVVDNPEIRFYAGAPIVLPDGSRIGTLCVIHRQPHVLTENQRAVLEQLALCAAKALAARRSLRANKEISMALQKSENLLERTGQLARVGGFEVDFVTGERTWSNEMFRIYGIPPGTVPDYEEAVASYPLHVRDMIETTREAARTRGEGYDLEVPFVRFDGQEIWVRSLGSVELEDGRPRRLVGLIQDITSRRRQQAVLEEAQANIKLATEAAGLGIWDYDLTTSELIWDAQQYRLFGLDPREEISAYDLWARHVHPDDLAEVERALQASIASGTDFISEFRIVWGNGSVHHLKAMGRLHFDAAGKPVRMVGTNMDITEAANYAQSLKDARAKAEEASQSKGQFLANMSHEIRTPMNAILGLLQLLRNTELSANQFDYVEKTEGAAKALLGLLNDILDFSKMDAGKMELECEPFSLDQVMRNLAVVLSASVGGKGIEVLFDIDTDLPDWLMGDAMRLLQVLINLGGNAVKFTSTGQVVVAVKRLAAEAGTTAASPVDSASVHFSVQDTGIGIAPEVQEKVFTDFSQAEAATTRKFGGTGLGLAICKRLVTLMGGEIALASTLGGGTTFSFSLQMPLPNTPQQDSADVHLPAKSPRVLLVDDNATARQLLAHMMRANAWEVDVAEGGMQALAMVERRASIGARPYDYLFLDGQLADWDSWQVVEALRSRQYLSGTGALKVILVSANGRDNLSLRTPQEQALVSGFLVKPVTRSVLRNATRTESTHEAALRREKRSSKRELQGLKVLVVEDNAINQQVAEELLGAQGALVSIAANGRQGVNAIASAKEQYDVVLMDIQMPVMDGYEATRVIREELGFRQLPIIGLTANAMASDRDKCLAAGMDAHVGKPFDIVQLVSVLLRLTGHRPVASAALVQDMAGAGASHRAQDLSNLVSDEMDLPAALQRMGGLHALYARSARDLLRMLPGLCAELAEAARRVDVRAVSALLHTYKGTTATLGLVALSRELGRLEGLSQSDFERTNWPRQLKALAAAVQLAQAALSQALTGLEVACAGATAAEPRRTDAPLIQAHLNRLLPLLRQRDMSAMEVYAQMREALEFAAPSAGLLDPLDNAMQALEFDAAEDICRSFVASGL